MRYLTPFLRRLIPIIVLSAVFILGSGCAKRPKPAELPETLPEGWSVQQRAAASLPDQTTDQAVLQPKPKQIEIAALTMTASLLDLLNDPSITGLVKEALANNPDLKATAARLRASGFLLSQTGSGRLPEISAGADRGRDNRSLDDAGKPDARNAYQISASISWELDVWGRITDLHQAQLLEHDALGMKYIQAYDALAARVIQAWISAVATLQTHRIEEERLAALIKIEDALMLRYREGLGSLEDYAASRTSHNP